MSERKQNFLPIKIGSAIATPLIVGGAIAFTHGRSIEDHRTKNREIAVGAIFRQADAVFPTPDRAGIDNAKTFTSQVQDELVTLIEQGKINEAKDALAQNSEGLKQAGQISENERLKSGVIVELSNKKGLGKPLGSSGYTALGVISFIGGAVSVMSGLLGQLDEWTTNRRLKNLRKTQESPTTL